MAWFCGTALGGYVFDDYADALEAARTDRDVAEHMPGGPSCDQHPRDLLEDDGEGYLVCLECQGGECSGCGGPCVEVDKALRYAFDEWCPRCAAQALTMLAGMHGVSIALAIGGGGRAVVQVENALGLALLLEGEVRGSYAAQCQLEAALRAAGDLTEGGTL